LRMVVILFLAFSPGTSELQGPAEPAVCHPVALPVITRGERFG